METIYLYGGLAIAFLNAKTRQSILSTILLLFALLCIPSLFAFDQYSLSLHNLIVLFAPYLSYQVGKYIASINSKYQEQLIPIFTVALLIIFIIVVSRYSSISIEIIELRDYAIAVSALFPFIFLIRNKTLKLIFSVLAFVIVLISVKRSLILGMALALILYYAIIIYGNKNYKFSRKLGLTFLILLLGLGTIKFTIATQDLNQMLEDRFENMGEDGGSGRVDKYDLIVKHLNNSPTSELLFGHGYNAVATRVSRYPAHNDLLEILYNHGIIASSLWALFIVFISIKAIHLISRKEIESGAILFAILAMWIIVFMTNCVYPNISISSSFYLFFGVFESQIKRNKNHAIPQSTSFR